jgi:hypothetical protein
MADHRIIKYVTVQDYMQPLPKNNDPTIEILDLIKSIVSEIYSPSSIWTLPEWDMLALTTIKIPHEHVNLNDIFRSYNYRLTNIVELFNDSYLYDIKFIYALLFWNIDKRPWKDLIKDMEISEILLNDFHFKDDIITLSNLFNFGCRDTRSKILTIPMFWSVLTNNEMRPSIFNEAIISVLPLIFIMLERISNNIKNVNILLDFTIPDEWFINAPYYEFLKFQDERSNKYGYYLSELDKYDGKLLPLINYLRERDETTQIELVNSNILNDTCRLRSDKIERLRCTTIKNYARNGICIVNAMFHTLKLRILRYVTFLRAAYFVYQRRHDYRQMAMIRALVFHSLTEDAHIFDVMLPYDRAETIYDALFVQHPRNEYYNYIKDAKKLLNTSTYEVLPDGY